MSKLAMHVEHYKRGSVGSLDRHNLREGDKHSNEDIDPKRSNENIQMLTPESGSLYATVKASAEQSTGRITANSVLVSEWVIYPEEAMQDPANADPDKLKRWGEDVLEWMNNKQLHPVAATIHLDETTIHMHVDTLPITQDGRFSRKELYTRAALAEYHTELAAFLEKRGWDIQRGEKRKAGEKGKSKTVREYKAWAEEEKARLDQTLQAARAETEAEQTRLEQSLQAARADVEAEQARLDQSLQAAYKVDTYIEQRAKILQEKEDEIAEIDQDIQSAIDWVNSNPRLAQEAARAEELRRLRKAQEESDQKAQAYEKELKWREEAIVCLREDLSRRVDDYMILQEKRKEAYQARTEAEETVKALEWALEDSGMISGIVLRMMLCGAQKEAEECRQRHENICAAVRSKKHQITKEQQRLYREKREMEAAMRKGAEKAASHSSREKQKEQER